MRMLFSLLMLVVLPAAGCSSNSPAGNGQEPRYDAKGNPVGLKINRDDEAQRHVAVAIHDGRAAISADNASVTFTLSTAGGEQVRGGFAEFTGELTVNSREKSIRALSLTVFTDSLWGDELELAERFGAENGLNVSEHATLDFRLNEVHRESSEPNRCELGGELRLRGETREIALPVEVTRFSHLLELNGTCEVDLAEYGLELESSGLGSRLALRLEVGVITRPVTVSRRPPADAEPAARDD